MQEWIKTVEVGLKQHENQHFSYFSIKHRLWHLVLILKKTKLHYNSEALNHVDLGKSIDRGRNSASKYLV